jgi:hypothetical protein
VAQGEAEKFVSLGQTSGFATEWLNPANWFHGDAYRNLRWDIGLTPHAPLDLDIHGGVGKSALDLRELNLSALDVTGGVGQIELTLPTRLDKLEARVQIGVGHMIVNVPAAGALNAHIKGGVGATHIQLPPDASVRIEASSGVGNLNLAARFQRVSGDESGFGLGQRGVWETAGFSSADRQIVIYFDGSVGELRVR